MSEHTGEPKPHQKAVIDAVVGLANSLLRWGRGAGQTWTRHEIAKRIIADDNTNNPFDLSEYLQGGDKS